MAEKHYLEPFLSVARRIVERAPGYKTIPACKAAMTRLKRAYERNGSYGVAWGQYREAVAAIQDRSLVIFGEQLDAK